MIKFLKRSSSVRVLLVEKTDRLYRNLKDYVTMDELDLRFTSSKKAWFFPKTLDRPRSSCTASRC